MCQKRMSSFVGPVRPRETLTSLGPLSVCDSASVARSHPTRLGAPHREEEVARGRVRDQDVRLGPCDGGRDGSQVVREEGLRRRARGAVDGGVVAGRQRSKPCERAQRVFDS